MNPLNKIPRAANGWMVQAWSCTQQDLLKRIESFEQLFVWNEPVALEVKYSSICYYVLICVRINFGIRFDSVILLLVCIICLFMWLLFFFYLIFYGVHVLLDHLMLVVHVFGDIWFSFPFLYSLFYCCTHKFWFDKDITIGLFTWTTLIYL